MNHLESPTVIRTSLEHKILTSFDLTTEDRSSLEISYILHWSGDYFRSLYEHSPLFERLNVKYQILFYQGDVRGILTSKKVAVSFRKLSPEYPYGYAMVRSNDSGN